MSGQCMEPLPIPRHTVAKEISNQGGIARSNVIVHIYTVVSFYHTQYESKHMILLIGPSCSNRFYFLVVILAQMTIYGM